MGGMELLTDNVAMSRPHRLVVVDTNCLVRLFFSSIRPLLSRPMAGHEFKTLDEMAIELRTLAEGDRHAWLNDPVILDEVNGAIITLTDAQRRDIDQNFELFRKRAQKMLRDHCIAQKTVKMRSFSDEDILALMVAMELDAALATDEWPLRLISQKFQANDAGDPVQLLCTVELLHIAETAGVTTPDERRKLYKEWANYGELLADAPQIYRRLFNEPPPSAQA